MREIKAGISSQKQVEVTENHTARAVGSGTLDVFGTPCMLALMEETTCLCIADCLQEGETTVGISAEIEHLAPTAVGKTVTAVAELVQTEGRRLTFRVTARDEVQDIGKGCIVRFIVDSKRFMEKALSK